MIPKNSNLLNLLFKNKTFIPFSLSVENPSVDTSNYKSIEEAETEILKFLDGKIGFGGYLEKRNVYQISERFGTERNIHLGVDFFGEVDTPIYCPLKGVVHSFAFNNKGSDYGATIILQHENFCTLYGHLALKNLDNLYEGKVFNQGDVLANFGNINENGGWPAHLHFQIIKNMGEHKGDYQGVCTANDLTQMAENSPNPFLYF